MPGCDAHPHEHMECGRGWVRLSSNKLNMRLSLALSSPGMPVGLVTALVSDVTWCGARRGAAGFAGRGPMCRGLVGDLLRKLRFS